MPSAFIIGGRFKVGDRKQMNINPIIIKRNHNKLINETKNKSIIFSFARTILEKKN